MSEPRAGYPSDVTGDEWAFAAPYLTLLREDAHQRPHDLRSVSNAVRWLVKTGAHWRYIPNDFPPWPAVYQQARRWLAAGVFEAIAHDLRMILRLVGEREAQPTAIILDGRTLQSTPESGGRAGYSRPGRIIVGTNTAIDAREWRPRRVRRGQEEERVEGPCGRGHAGAPAGAAGDGGR